MNINSSRYSINRALLNLKRKRIVEIRGTHRPLRWGLSTTKENPICQKFPLDSWAYRKKILLDNLRKEKILNMQSLTTYNKLEVTLRNYLEISTKLILISEKLIKKFSDYPEVLENISIDYDIIDSVNYDFLDSTEWLSEIKDIANLKEKLFIMEKVERELEKSIKILSIISNEYHKQK